MQAVILAAGKGERMGNLTTDTPKPLLEYKEKSLLEWKFDALPENISEIILVIGYLGERIQEKFGDSYKGKKITYVWDKEMKGTGLALWKTRDVLKEKFLVMMGDDIYDEKALENATKEDWSITVMKVPFDSDTSRIETDKNGKLINFLTALKYREKYNDNGLAFTGLYSLRKEIFDYPLVKMKTRDEWGLPQTLLQTTQDISLKILEANFWKPITSPEDLK